MLIKQIAILLLLAIFCLAEDYPHLRALWEQDGSVNIFGEHIDLATECDGKPCNYPDLFTYDQAELDELSCAPAGRDRVICDHLPDNAILVNDLSPVECEDEVCGGSKIFSMSDEDWDENFGDDEKDIAFQSGSRGGGCATTAQARSEIREQRRRAKQRDQTIN